MKRFLITVTLIFSSFLSFSQIDKYLENVVLIQSTDKEHSGSGFLYYTGNNLYLLTAKHVLMSQKDDLLYNEIMFYSYPHDAQKENAKEYSINLKEAYEQKKARYGTNFDIIAIQIGIVSKGIVDYFNFIKTGPTSNINNFSINDCILNLDSISVGEDIYVIGYPKSLEVTQYDNFNFNRPLTRKGIISGKDYIHNTILIDCPSYGGNSGGPVLLKRKDEIKMIGLVSSYVPYIEFWINPVSNIKNIDALNSGLTVVTPFYRIIMDLYKKELWEQK